MASRYINVPNHPGIKYNSVSRMYLVYRKIKGVEQYQGQIKSLTEAIKVRDAFEKALPAETTAQTNIRTRTFSGKIDPKEIRKAARFFYKRGEIASPNYIELLKPQKDKVRTNVQKGHTPGKFSKITQFTPLSKSAQNKILKYFPDADFDSWKKGFDQTTDPVRFNSVDEFITRGYKPAFHNVKDLPKKTQDFIIEAFGKEAAAAGTPIRFGPGRKFGIPPGENQVLNSRITNFLNNIGRAYPYAFNFQDKPANWIIQQMARAADKKNPDYKVLRNEAGKIIGASENGVKYYHVNSLIGNSIANHPEAKQISKFVNVARESKASIPQSLLKIFPKGFDRNLLHANRAYTDLLQWLDNSQGRRLVANAIQVHHAGEGSVAGSPALARDLQLLTAPDNVAAASIKTTIERDLKAGRDPFTSEGSRIPELKEKGIRLNVGGVEYGAGAETAEAGIKRIEKAQLPKLQAQLKIDPKLGGFANFLKQAVIGANTNAGGMCNIPSIVGKKAGGGRVGFAAGSNCARQMEISISQNPVKVTEEIAALPGNKAINTLKNTAKGLLGTLGKFGARAAPLAALAGVGAVLEPLVKQFKIDDPTTYLTDESQMKGMLLATIEGETPKVDDEILKWQLPALGAATATGAIPGAREAYLDRLTGRGPAGPAGTKLPATIVNKPVGKVRAALGIKGVLGKALGASFSPLGVAATLPMDIAAQRKGGTEWGDIATDPTHWMAPAFASAGYEAAKAGIKNPILLKALRMGISPGALRMISSKFGIPGLAISGGMWGYDKWKNRSVNDD